MWRDFVNGAFNPKCCVPYNLICKKYFGDDTKIHQMNKWWCRYKASRNVAVIRQSVEIRYPGCWSERGIHNRRFTDIPPIPKIQPLYSTSICRPAITRACRKVLENWLNWELFRLVTVSAWLIVLFPSVSCGNVVLSREPVYS